MTLHIIGIGLYDEKDITLRGLETLKRCSKVFLESYTSVLHCTKIDLEQLYEKPVITADRTLVENRADEILTPAQDTDVAFLVVGDPMTATTHLDLVLRARRNGITVNIIHNAGIMTAVGVVGLELYKYGKTTSIVYPEEDWAVQTHYNVIKENRQMGLHTLCLLDIKTSEPLKSDIRQSTTTESATHPAHARFMTVNEGIQSLLEIEKSRKEAVFTDDTVCIGCARLGSPDQVIKAGTAKQVLQMDFGKELHCLIIPGKLHFMEEEALDQWK